MTHWLRDPADSNPENLLIERESWEDPEPEAERDKNRFSALLARIPSEEAAVIALTAQGQSQDAIAEELGIRQSTVSYRLSRALERFRWLTGTGAWFDGKAAQRALCGPLRPIEAKALVIWWETASQAKTAIRIRRSPAGAREILVRATETLRDSVEVDPRFPLAFLALWRAGSILQRPERRI